MKKKTIKIKLSSFKFLLFLPILLLSYCDSNLEEPVLNSEKGLSKDAKVFSLMKAAVQSDSDKYSTSNKTDLAKGTETETDDQCTYFLYPMYIDVYVGDNPVPEEKEINSDEELIAFIDGFTFEEELSIATTPNYEMYIRFPIILLDSDGVETELNNLIELEGTLEMAVEVCASLENDGSGSGSDDGSGSGSDDGSGSGTEDGSGGGTDDGSGSGTDDGSGSGTDDGSGSGTDDGSGSGSDDGSDSGTDGGSGSGSDDGSGSGTDDGSGSGSDDGTGSGSDDGSGSGSDDGSGSGSDDGSGSGSDNGSGESSDDSSGESSDDDSGSGSDDGSGSGSDDGSGESSDNGSEEESLSTDENDSDSEYEYCDKNKKKVIICHKGKTICVSINALWGHLYHHSEDTLGSCED
ncbi:hypothetical protein LCM02_04865 [Lutimonas saemankumensis]|uniref:hypothetical protein n=1 Tax=Lutimonas saemankumensis TaxID=483016 RepID=UPI001CD2BD0B|nr:hypothetical protein [Lutimonas saemankumensis]MCA0931773.1 hypothetical protein [Lutimonas saemankumensis]